VKHLKKFTLKSIIVISSIIIILMIIIGIYLIYFNETDENPIDYNIFKNMAKNTPCADIANKLYVIDNQIVFWAVEGNCPDASYSYSLFGNTPEEIICKRYDSIAGPIKECNDESYMNIFQIIIDNLDSDNLGLNGTHKVTEISF
jgi:hypothetical protein